MEKLPSELQKANQLRWVREGQLVRDEVWLASMITRYEDFLKESDKKCIRQLMFTLSIERYKVRDNYNAFKKSIKRS